MKNKVVQLKNSIGIEKSGSLILKFGKFGVL